jgi:hypothetical protein
LACEEEHPIVKQGYWWSWNDTSKDQIQFMKFVKQLKVESDSYEETSTKFTGRLPIVYRCLIEESCQGGIENEKMCTTGYVGPLCALCDKDYFYWFNSCHRCPPVWRGLLQLSLVAFIFLLIIFALVKADRLRRNHSRGVETAIDQIASKAKILIGFSQVMGGILSALSLVPWPEALLRFGGWTKVLELNIVEIANPSCFSSHFRINFLERTVLNFAGQFLLLSAIFVYFHLRYSLLSLIFSCLRKRNHNRSLARRSCLGNSWWILFLCYPSSTTKILATLPYKDWTCIKLCHYGSRLQDDCIWFLKADLSIRCDFQHGSNRSLYVICWAMALYIILLPLLLLCGLYKRHLFLTMNSVSEDPAVSTRKKFDGLKTDFFSSLSFIDENYKPKFWYWELLEMARKFLLTCGLTYFGSNSLSGVALAALIANVFVLLHIHLKPTRRKSDYALQLMSLLVTSLSLMFGTLIVLEESSSFASANAGDRQVFHVLVLLVHGIFVLYLSGRLLFAIYRSVKKCRKHTGRFKLLPFLIYFFSDEYPDEEEDSVVCSAGEDGDDCMTLNE